VDTIKLDTMETVADAAKHILADGAHVAHKIGNVDIADEMFPLLVVPVELEELVVLEEDTQIFLDL
jgi:hypothetical protein